MAEKSKRFFESSWDDLKLICFDQSDMQFMGNQLSYKANKLTFNLKVKEEHCLRPEEKSVFV